MAETYYPRRKRCKRCRKYFAGLVVDRLYDSYECAGAKPPDEDPERWPREHAFYLKGILREKQTFVYPTEPRVRELLEQQADLEVYQCRYCLMYHVGHSRPPPVERR